MAAENKTNLPSGSVDAIPKDASADESVKAAKCGTTGAFPFEVTRSAPNPSDALKTVNDMLDNGYKVVDMKIEKNGSVSMTFQLPKCGAPEIVDADQHQHEREILIQTVIRFLNVNTVTQFPGGDNEEMVVKLIDLPPEIEKKDVATTVENRKLVMELNTAQPVVEEYGKIKKVVELPVDATGSTVSTVLEGQTLTVKVTLEKPKPEKKPKLSSQIWRFAKGAINKAAAACVVVGAKMACDKMNNGEPNAQQE